MDRVITLNAIATTQKARRVSVTGISPDRRQATRRLADGVSQMAKRKRESCEEFDAETPGVVMDLLQELAAEARLPAPQQSVHKDECVYSFDSPVREKSFICAVI